MANGFFSAGLGRDFWKFRIGQLVSVLGDACGSIALAWWVLDRTGSAAEMSSILAPAMVARIFLLPVCGPIADRFSRKTLLVLSDLWRFAFSAAIFAMVCSGYYNFSLVLASYVLLSVGSALFSATSGGIIPKIVKREHISLAARQSQALNSFGSVAGGIVGGIVVSIAGVRGAFGIDCVSFLAAAVFTGLIRADTRPVGGGEAGGGFERWRRDFAGGFGILLQIPLLFWLCVIAMFINLCVSPLAVVLPVLVKEARSMPAWFLGGLESSISLGSILGAISVGWAARHIRGRTLMMGGIAMIGVGVSLLPWVPNAILPLTVLFWVGVGSSWANIPLVTQLSLTVPDAYRG
ncbi:MAG: MFS transporter, partial [Bdellovibrionota bacterium]